MMIELEVFDFDMDKAALIGRNAVGKTMVLSMEVTLVGDEEEEIVLANTKRVLNRAWALIED